MSNGEKEIKIRISKDLEMINRDVDNLLISRDTL